MSALKHVPNIARIKEFPPGHMLETGKQFVPFVNLKPTGRLNSEIVAKTGIFEHLTAAVRRRMLHSNVPVAFLCSGGVDSSILLCIGHQIWTQELGRSAADLQVFTLEYESSQAMREFCVKNSVCAIRYLNSIARISKKMYLIF